MVLRPGPLERRMPLAATAPWPVSVPPRAGWCRAQASAAEPWPSVAGIGRLEKPQSKALRAQELALAAAPLRVSQVPGQARLGVAPLPGLGAHRATCSWPAGPGSPRSLTATAALVTMAVTRPRAEAGAGSLPAAPDRNRPRADLIRAELGAVRRASQRPGVP